MLTFIKVSLFYDNNDGNGDGFVRVKVVWTTQNGEEKKLLEKLVLARTAITHMKYVKACRVSEKDDDEDILHYSILLVMIWGIF